MLLAKIKEKLFNRRNTVEIEDIKGELPESFKESLIPFIKQNGIAFDENYYFDEEVRVGTIPDDYSGTNYRFLKNGKIEIYLYNHGDITKYVELDYNDLVINDIHFSQKPTLWETDKLFEDLDEELLSKLKIGDLIYSSFDQFTALVDDIQDTEIYIKYYTSDTIYNIIYTFENDEWSCELTETPLTMVGLTHSFNELDPTLKTIVEDAIVDGGCNGVACTQAQWDVIKSLLDKSLYINFDGLSMIKSATNGINGYIFGSFGQSLYGETLELLFDDTELKLFVKYSEL